MKILFFCFCSVIVGFCQAQNLNTEIFDDSLKKQVNVGLCTPEGLQSGLWADFFEQTYNNYKPAPEILDELKGKLQNITIRIVFASWCGDSKEQVPAFYKILKELDYPYETIELIAVNRVFNGVLYDISGLSIRHVPTFIFYRNGQEIGRIIETPEITLEKDMLKIISK